jgi:hypothetical protein
MHFIAHILSHLGAHNQRERQAVIINLLLIVAALACFYFAIVGVFRTARRRGRKSRASVPLNPFGNP